MQLLYNTQIDKIIELALEEDIGSGDITTLSTIPEGTGAHGRFIAKQDTVICGIDIAKKVFHTVDSSVVFTAYFSAISMASVWLSPFFKTMTSLPALTVSTQIIV